MPAGLRFSLLFLSLRIAKNGIFFWGLRGWGEVKEDDLGVRNLKVLKIYCYSILTKINFYQWDNRLLRSHSIFNVTKCLYNFPRHITCTGINNIFMIYFSHVILFDDINYT